jgi:hypothetical protein
MKRPALKFFVIFLICFEARVSDAKDVNNADNSDGNKLLVAQNSPDWKIPHKPQRFRFGLSLGDMAGGPVRYNTQFPDLKGDPHPASYYHAQSFYGIEVEWSLSAGGLILQYLSRQDSWHRNIVNRSTEEQGQSWTVKTFNFKDTGFYLGWVLGERYFEAPWSVDLGFAYDVAEIKGSMVQTIAPSEANDFRLHLESISGRTRILFCTTGSGFYQFGFGPEIYMPLWSRMYDGSQKLLYGWVGDRLQLKNSAGIGLTGILNIRF